MPRVIPGSAAVYFCLVVILTMLSAYYFDPRLLWDKRASDGIAFNETENMTDNSPPPNGHAQAHVRKTTPSSLPSGWFR